nr:unnamed protein product [Callosobruchus chinensis]
METNIGGGQKPLKGHLDSECHSLVPGDEQRRMIFCEWLTRMCDENREFPNTIVCSGESYFCNNGMFNRNNRHYWVTQN